MLPTGKAAAPVKQTNVFVVYGHDSQARTQLEAMLRRWGLNPILLDQLPSEGQTVIEKLEAASSTADFAVVLATPDDEGHRAGHADENAFRARQNVVLELGMLLSKLGRSDSPEGRSQNGKALGHSRADLYSVQGRRFRDAGVNLAKEMNAKGFHIDLSKL